MTTNPQIKHELHAIKTAVATLKKLGYEYKGTALWEKPDNALLTPAEALQKNGWYRFWTTKYDARLSSDGYCSVFNGDMAHYTLDGNPRVCPTPFPNRGIAFEKCDLPFAVKVSS